MPELAKDIASAESSKPAVYSAPSRPMPLTEMLAFVLMAAAFALAIVLGG
jgi:hypothetical protein